MISRWGSQILAEDLELGCCGGGDSGAAIAGRPTSAQESGVTCSAGLAGFGTPGSMVTWFTGSAGSNRPRGSRKATPASFKYAEIVSRRTSTSRSIRRSDHPSRPKAMICCFFSSLKTLLTVTEDSVLTSAFNVLNMVYNWPVFRRPRLAGFG